VLYDECKVVDDAYLSMQSIGTVKERSSAALLPAGTSLGQQPTYSNNTTTRMDSRGNGIPHQVPEMSMEEEKEERYIIIVH